MHIAVLCLPDVDRAIGGVKQLYRHVEHLVAIGYDAYIITEKPSFRPTWFLSSAPSKCLEEFISTENISPGNTIFVIPETYIMSDLSNLYGFDLSGYYYVIFNQNAYYTYSRIEDDAYPYINKFYHSEKLLQVLSVSVDSAEFLLLNIGISDSMHSRIINCVEDIFTPSDCKDNIVSWMPRKNASHVQAVLAGLQVSFTSQSTQWKGQPLEGISHTSVASLLGASRLFLAFGHPEGFGLPIAEAMASGCWVVGYSGGGGKELFGFGASSLIEFGDWYSFVRSINDVIHLFEAYPRQTVMRIDRQSAAIKSLYNYDSEHLSIVNAWSTILEHFHSI